MIKSPENSQRREDQNSAMFSLFGGILCFALSTWFALELRTAPVSRVGMLGMFCFWGGVVILFLLSIVGVYVAYGFNTGRLDAVTGSMDSAVLIQGGKPVLQGYPIRLKRIYNWEDRSIPDEERDFLFTCRWRPWVCKTRKFLQPSSDD